MATFKIYFNSMDTEEVEATRYYDLKSWVVFEVDDELGMSTEILRLKASNIFRIERISP